MADRLSQLQDSLNQLAEHFCNSIGIIQETAPKTLQENDGKDSNNDSSKDSHAHLFATLISHTVKDIDYLIDALPSEKSTTELQMKSLVQLEEENQAAYNELQSVVNEGEKLLEEIRSVLKETSTKILQSRCKNFIIEEPK